MFDQKITRRDALRFGASASSLALFSTPSWGKAAAPAARRSGLCNHVCVFEKFIQTLSFDELAEKIAEMGFDGVEATVRKGGHIEPERVAEDLPRFVKALEKQGLTMTIMTSDVLDADDPINQRVLSAAADNGVTRYRTALYRYDPSKPVLEQLDGWKPGIEKLAALNRRLGLTGLYQNHSGYGFVGGTVWDLHRLISDIDPLEVGSAFDIRHATVESGLSWDVLYRLMRPHIGIIYVKDFRWEGRKAEHAPLGSGIDPRFFTMLREDNYEGPISLHVEHLPNAPAGENLEAIRKDYRVLRGWLQG